MQLVEVANIASKETGQFELWCNMRDDDFAWLTEHSSELCRRYAGKWIAVRDGKVIGIGDTAVEAAEQAREIADDADFLLETIDAEADVIYAHS